jgi:hypothetical protein
MSHPLPNNHVLIAQLRDSLTRQGYTAKVIRNHCTDADRFLYYLSRRRITVEAVTPAEVTNYLHYAARQLRQRHGHSLPTGWLSRTRAGIHALLRLMQQRWPPEFVVSNACEAFCKAVCREYQDWLRVQRGLAASTVDDLVAETRRYLLWYTERTGALNFKQLGAVHK